MFRRYQKPGIGFYPVPCTELGIMPTRVVPRELKPLVPLPG
jgi:hypothetical protein